MQISPIFQTTTTSGVVVNVQTETGLGSTVRTLVARDAQSGCPVFALYTGHVTATILSTEFDAVDSAAILARIDA